MSADVISGGSSVGDVHIFVERSSITSCSLRTNNSSFSINEFNIVSEQKNYSCSRLQLFTKIIKSQQLELARIKSFFEKYFSHSALRNN